MTLDSLTAYSKWEEARLARYQWPGKQSYLNTTWVEELALPVNEEWEAV